MYQISTNLFLVLRQEWARGLEGWGETKEEGEGTKPAELQHKKEAQSKSIRNQELVAGVNARNYYRGGTKEKKTVAQWIPKKNCIFLGLISFWPIKLIGGGRSSKKGEIGMLGAGDFLVLLRREWEEVSIGHGVNALTSRSQGGE